MMKTCPNCKQDLLVESFNRSNRRDGYQTYCRECHNHMQRKKYNLNPEEKIKRQIREARRKSKKPLAKKDAELQRLYGITVDDYLNILESQDGVCKICHKDCKTKSRLSVDHNHSSGKVRGLLCNRCNRAIGMFEDSPELLLSAISYLQDN
jgi:uncharacterized protein YbaR (Trm112 family)